MAIGEKNNIRTVEIGQKPCVQSTCLTVFVNCKNYNMVHNVEITTLKNLTIKYLV